MPKGFAEEIARQVKEAARMKEVCKEYSEWRWKMTKNFIEQAAIKGHNSCEMGNLLPDEVKKLESEGFVVSAKMNTNCPVWTITWDTETEENTNKE